MSNPFTFSRRQLIHAGTAASLAGGALLPAWARSGPGTAASPPSLSGDELTLTIDRRPFSSGGRTASAIMINGQLPAPLLRLREGQHLKIHVDNRLDEATSIHWHGLILPFQMDGVPGVSFPGIAANSRFTYDFPIVQSGTYWYHSHSGMQEQLGHYGPIVIDPAGRLPYAFDREHVVVLSDWTFDHPGTIIRRLKAEAGYLNRQRQTLLGRGSAENRMGQDERSTWAAMRMDPTDIADVTATTYRYLVNGHGPAENWTGLFRPGETVLLRVINAAAMTIFNLRIPDLSLTVVAADGQPVEPLEVDELQIGNAETYDILVRPADRAYTLVAESIDRSGLGRATLAPQLGMQAPVPPLRPRPTLTMTDMGMGGHAGHGMDHGSMDMRDTSLLPPQVKVGPGIDMVAMAPIDRTGHPGLGLDDVGHRVLTYKALKALTPFTDQRPPSRAIEVHLTGNMERFMWSIDGQKFSEMPEPIRLARNERVRFTLINHSMMTHPMHIHGHFFQVVNGAGAKAPIKHTVRVLPGEKLSFDMTADAPGDWAFHCHLLMHMDAGMMRVVTVRPLDPTGERA